MQRLFLYLLAALARIWLFPIYWLSGFMPRRRHLWVFGSWGGHRYADNGAAFFEYCHDHISDHVTLVWISRNRRVVGKIRKAGHQAYWIWSPMGILSCLLAGVYVFDCFSKDINFWFSRSATKVCLWSGVPLKVFERSIDAPSSRYYQLFHGRWGIRHLLAALMPWHVIRPDLLIAASDEAKEIVCRGFDVSPDRVAVTGLPRNDALFHPIPRDAPGMPESYTMALEQGRKVFLYLPTLRESGKAFMNIDWLKLDQLMNEIGAHFFVKLHPADTGTVRASSERVTTLDPDVGVYDILPHTGCLVSDYSSIIWDFMLLGRPIVYYLPDHEEFISKSRSLNFDVVEIAGGTVCRDSGELLESLRLVGDTGSGGDSTALARYAQSADRLNRYKDDQSSRRTLEALGNAGIYDPDDDLDVGDGVFGTEMTKLLGGSAFIFLCRVGGAGLAFLTQILLARLMGAAELGVYVWALSWMILLSTLSGLGLHEAGIRFVGEALVDDAADRIRGFVRRSGQIVFSSALILAGIGYLVALPGTGIVSADARRPLLIALTAIPAYAFLEFQTSIANGMSWFRLSFLPNNVIRPLVFLLLILMLWATGGQIDATLALEVHWTVIGIVFLCVGMFMWRYMQQSLAQGGYEYQTLAWLRTSLPLLAVTATNSFFPEIMVILVSAMLPSADVAIFNAGFRTALLVVFGLHAVDGFVAPQAARLLASGDTDSLQDVVNRATRLRFWGAVAGALILVVTGRWLLALFGTEFDAAYPVLVILALTQIIRGGTGPSVRLLCLGGYQNKCMAVFAVALSVAVILVLLLVPRYGVVGAAASASVSIVVWSLWLRMIVVRCLGVTPEIR